MEKNCSFQMSINRRFTEHSPITKEEGIGFLKKYKSEFIRACENGDDAEMVLWVNMEHSSDYKETYEWINSEETKVVNGVLYKLVQLKF